MLELLKQKNPELKLHHVAGAAFETYGRVVTDMDVEELMTVAGSIPSPPTGSSYTASLPELEALAVSAEIQDRLFGTLPTQIGYCWGHSNYLNAAEWHSCSEINVAVTPLVLFLGHVWDIKDGKLDADQFQAFYVPKGTVLEVYATTLHFCPCEVNAEGFGCVVALPSHTNTDLHIQSKDKTLFRKNKWIIAHEKNQALIDRGVVPGITGCNHKIKY